MKINKSKLDEKSGCNEWTRGRSLIQRENENKEKVEKKKKTIDGGRETRRSGTRGRVVA